MADGLNTGWPDLDCAGDGIAPGPLGGVAALDFSPVLPGTFATTGLADLGADGMKVEVP